ncbi:MAG: DUF4349 domain-containing protein [Spirochaetes bacterium]|nr:DUF4349 domain-containing protein [Spirochaetota bacterium]
MKIIRSASVCIIIAIFLSLLLLPSCGKQKEYEDKSMAGKDSFMVNEKAKISLSESKDKKPASPGEERKKEGLTSYLFSSFEKAEGRLLEYHVDLVYRSDDVLSARQKLLKIVNEYGFIKQSSSSADRKNVAVSAEIFVQAKELYRMLIAMEDLGVLISENINVTDHTENMFWQEIKIRREQMRLIRKNRALNEISSRTKGWQERDDSLTRSEDQLDSSDFEKWKINDRVKWAKIYLTLQGPEKTGAIRVPKYENALISAVNVLLGILYILLWLIPFAIIFFIIWWKRKKITGIFKTNKKKK